MGKMTLTPENDLQELWEMNGRVKATVAYLKASTYINSREILSMLGGLGGVDDGLPMQDGDKD